jgi:hypothetical protein
VLSLQGEILTNKGDINDLWGKVTSNYDNLYDQIDCVEKIASDSAAVSEEANDRSIDNEANIDDCIADIDTVSGGLTSLEDTVSDIILTGADEC